MAQWKNTTRRVCVCAYERVLRSVPLSKQPSFVKLFRLSAHLPARFSVSYPSPPPLCSHVPWFLRIGPAEPILSQLLRAFVGSCLLWPGSRVERSSSAPPPPSFFVLLRTNASPSINSAAIGRSGGRTGRGGCYYPLNAYRWPPARRLNAGLLCVPCFLAGHKDIWMSRVGTKGVES